MNKNLMIGLGVFIAVVAVGFYLAKTKINTVPTQTISTQTTASAIPSGPIHEIAISAKEYSFSPSVLTVTKGENVRITFTNNGSFPHNITISDLNLKTDTISSGDSTTLEFVASKTGSFEFHCSVGGHKDLGMQGTLEVK